MDGCMRKIAVYYPFPSSIYSSTKTKHKESYMAFYNQTTIILLILFPLSSPPLIPNPDKTHKSPT